MLSAPEIVTAPTATPVSVADVKSYIPVTLPGEDAELADLIEGVTLDAEQRILWRAIVTQQRRVQILSQCPPRAMQVEPFRTDRRGRGRRRTSDAAPRERRWHDRGCVDADLYYTVPSEGIVALKKGERWPIAERDIAPYDLTYWAGWNADDVPSDLKRMVIRAAVSNHYHYPGVFSEAGQASMVLSEHPGSYREDRATAIRFARIGGLGGCQNEGRASRKRALRRCSRTMIRARSRRRICGLSPLTRLTRCSTRLGL